ncbi:hypothetical protein CTI12_AA142260 (chloroplast) [Artemisia annua]|uniref:Uncharacterized protein n=1 Tax=Artemisia annua TaxID=35608 RepID=A0A2U1PJV0_ARTAN|nr:hypothetical protein CTI12_AA142260 [Artemisia annua]
MEMNSYARRFTKRSKYQRLNDGSNTKKKSWRVKIAKRLRWKGISPRNLWISFKHAYIRLMLNMAGNVGYLTSGTGIMSQKLPARASGRRISASRKDFDDRLLNEILKNFVASRDLATV